MAPHRRRTYSGALFPVVSCIAGNTARATLLRATPDPFLASVDAEPEDHDALVSPTPQYNRPTTFNRLVFESDTLAAWLGFRVDSYGRSQVTRTRPRLSPQRTRRARRRSWESIIVESLTLPIRSYNASYDPVARSGRASIPAVLANPDRSNVAEEDPLVFNAPFPTHSICATPARRCCVASSFAFSAPTEPPSTSIVRPS